MVSGLSLKYAGCEPVFVIVHRKGCDLGFFHYVVIWRCLKLPFSFADDTDCLKSINKKRMDEAGGKRLPKVKRLSVGPVYEPIGKFKFPGRKMERLTAKVKTCATLWLSDHWQFSDITFLGYDA